MIDLLASTGAGSCLILATATAVIAWQAWKGRER